MKKAPGFAGGRVAMVDLVSPPAEPGLAGSDTKAA
jgi:hypothetical protein